MFIYVHIFLGFCCEYPFSFRDQAALKKLFRYCFCYYVHTCCLVFLLVLLHCVFAVNEALFYLTTSEIISGKSRSHTPESDVSLEASERNPETFENEDARENAKNNNVSAAQLPKRSSMSMRGKAAASATTVTV